MNVTFQNVLQLLAALAPFAWPAVVIASVFLFRKAIIGAVGRAKQIKAKGVEIVLDTLAQEGQLPIGARAELAGLTSHDIWALQSFATEKIPDRVDDLTPAQRVAARTLSDAGLLAIVTQDGRRIVVTTDLGHRVLEMAKRLL